MKIAAVAPQFIFESNDAREVKTSSPSLKLLKSSEISPDLGGGGGSGSLAGESSDQDESKGEKGEGGERPDRGGSGRIRPAAAVLRFVPSSNSATTKPQLVGSSEVDRVHVPVSDLPPTRMLLIPASSGEQTKTAAFERYRSTTDAREATNDKGHVLDKYY